MASEHLQRESLTMTKMVGIYCAAHHYESGLCDDCSNFLEYARVRLDKCPYGEDKPTCANCPVHCYKKEYREQARTIMRYAGPRMLLRHPLLTISHYMDGRRRSRHPRELTRDERLDRKKGD